MQHRREFLNTHPQFKATTSRRKLSTAGGASVEREVTTLSGYAMVWNSLSSDRGGYKVKLLPWSAIFADPTHALYNHDFSNVLGSTANGTLRITPDSVGVKVEIDLPDTQCGRDVGKLVAGGYIGGMSFSMLFDGMKTQIVTAPNGDDVDEVSSFVCDEVTITAIPSFGDTSIAVASDAASPAKMSTVAEHSLRLQRLALAMRSPKSL